MYFYERPLLTITSDGALKHPNAIIRCYIQSATTLFISVSDYLFLIQRVCGKMD